VSLWKGITKPLMALGLGIAVLGAFFHYITRGPKEVEDSSNKGG
jgi:formate dehydrogenase iron-sulfur subunit